MTKKEEKFIAAVWDFYRLHGRHRLPWRQTHNPYRIAVSEIMLQQTQVERVIPKYQAFIKTFPTVAALAAAPLGDVLGMWQGLGYNRRAKLLQQCAVAVITEHNGRFPKTFESLLSLPGIGPYTAGAVMAFAYNSPVPLIETNVRTVFIHHFFKDVHDVKDSDILALVSRTLDTDNPRDWYAALMDYGSYLKKATGNNTAQSAAYIKQSRFTGSNRQMRGYILRALHTTPASSYKDMAAQIPNACTIEQLDIQLDALIAEGLVVKTRNRYSLPGVVQLDRNKDATSHKKGKNNKD